MRRITCLPAVLLILIALASLPAGAQTRFTFSGTVVDSTGAPIVGARVSMDAGTPASPDAVVSDQAGSFVLTLSPGRHTVTVASDGFVPLTVTVNASATGAESRTLTLQIAGFRDT